MHLSSSRKLKTCYVNADSNADSNRWRVACRAVSSARRTSSWCVIHHLWWSSTSLGSVLKDVKSVPKAKAATRCHAPKGLFCHFLFFVSFPHRFRISSSFFFQKSYSMCVFMIYYDIYIYSYDIHIQKSYIRIFSTWFFDSPWRHACKSRHDERSLGNLQLRSTSPPAAGAGAGRWTLRHLQQTKSLGPGPDDDHGETRMTWWSWKKQQVVYKKVAEYIS